MNTLERLKLDAILTTQWRGHLLGVWEDTETTSSASCTRCGKGVGVDTDPPPNGIDIDGSALALGCEED